MLQITTSTRHAIFLEVILNGEARTDCIGVDLDTSEAILWVQPSPGDTSLATRETLRIKGDIQLRFIMPPIDIGVERAIEDMRHSVLWHALSNEERQERMKDGFNDSTPLPRDEESKVIFEKLFRNYLEEMARVKPAVSVPGI